MSKHGTWTVVFPDKRIIKRTGEFDTSTATGYVIDDDTFWGQSKFDSLHAIQFTDDNTDNDQVEHNDGSPHSAYDASVLGNFSQFITKWDSAHLAQLQQDWDDDNEQVEDPADSGTYRDETEAEKIARLGARPTTYTS